MSGEDVFAGGRAAGDRVAGVGESDGNVGLKGTRGGDGIADGEVVTGGKAGDVELENDGSEAA